MNQNGQSFLICDNLVKIYKVADLEVVALQGLDLQVEQGEMVALVGASGSGKSTLLNLIGALDTPSAGRLQVGQADLLNLRARERVHYQRHVVGFVWQQPARNLIPYLSAQENVELPMMLSGLDAGTRRQRALELLEMVQLSDRATFRPDRLSGGQQQRVALAVALANNPPLLLADEPTGQVDSESARHVYESLRRLNASYGTTILIVTHDPTVANHVGRVVGIRDGRTSTELRRVRNLQDGSVQDEEWVIMDQAGRIQLPRSFLEELGLAGRVKVKLEPDHVSVWPHGVAGQGPAGQGPAGQGPAEQGPAGPPPATVDREAALYWRPKRDEQTTTGERPRVPAVVTTQLCRTFSLGVEAVKAVDQVSLAIEPGVLAVVRGPSGSGKTTLLNLIAGLDEPTSGDVQVAGRSLSSMSSAERVALRREEIGFVFQTFGLLPYLSAQENVEVPLRLVHTPRRERRLKVAAALDLVGLAERAHHRTYELSGGEQQRVALARALVNQPSLILADEPTGQLDSLTGSAIIALLRDIVTQTGITVIIASHDPKVLEEADVVFRLKDGRLLS